MDGRYSIDHIMGFVKDHNIPWESADHNIPCELQSHTLPGTHRNMGGAARVFMSSITTWVCMSSIRPVTMHYRQALRQ